MYDRVKIKSEAKQCLSLHFGTVFGVVIVSSLILTACVAIPTVGTVASAVLKGVLGVGVAIVLLRVIRGEPFKFSDMFNGFNNFGTNCLAGILMSVFTFLWSLLFIIPGIVKAYSYSMTNYILAEHPEFTASGAIKESQRIMHGHKADLFVLRLSFIGWALLCVVTFGLATIYVMPYMQIAEAKFYDSIKDNTYEFTNSYDDDRFDD